MVYTPSRRLLISAMSLLTSSGVRSVTFKSVGTAAAAWSGVYSRRSSKTRVSVRGTESRTTPLPSVQARLRDDARHTWERRGLLFVSVERGRQEGEDRGMGNWTFWNPGTQLQIVSLSERGAG